jgi:hypothetical protein
MACRARPHKSNRTSARRLATPHAALANPSIDSGAASDGDVRPEPLDHGGAEALNTSQLVL